MFNHVLKQKYFFYCIGHYCIGVPCYLPFQIPPSPLKPTMVKFFIYCAVLMKFETQHIHMLTNNNLD